MNDLLRIIKSTRTLWGMYAFVGSASIIVALTNLLLPLVSGWAIDEIRVVGDGAEPNISRAIWLAAAVFGLDLTSTLVSNIGGYVGDKMAARLETILSNRYFERLLQLPQSFFDRELSGKLINRLNRSIAQIANFLHMMSNNFLQFIFTTIFSLIAVSIFSPAIALLLFTLYPIYIWMTVRTSNKWVKYQQEKNKHQDIASGRFAEAISQMKVVKSFNQQIREFSFFNKHLLKSEDINKPQSAFWHKQDVKRRVVLNFIFFGVYALIFVQGVRGAFTPGEAVTLILYAMNIRIPIFTISFLVENTQRAVADSKDYFEVLEEKVDDHENEDKPHLKLKAADIKLSDAAFGYADGENIVQGISFEIASGQTVALVGESGAGKTTITNLLMRLYPLNNGTIEINGQDISEHSLHSLRESIGVVFQDPSLFSGTIKENIAYAKKKASMKEIEAAAKAANAHEFISGLEKGYDTEIGERGLKLSGGQKQRIAIARALLKNAPILILDEATSSLDSRSESLVQEALEHLMQDRTTIIIAHRLSTIAKVDKLVTLKNGRVDEIGSPQELAKSGGIYSNLLKLQDSSSVLDKNKLKEFEISS